MNSVLVIGSINMDLVANAACFPAPGETVLGQSFSTFPGGKGANQAVAARRLGAQVTMIGRVGSDAFGEQMVARLRQEGIDTSLIRTTHNASTGVATITVCQSENSIVVVPGANHQLSAEDVLAAEAAFSSADVVLAQLEVPLPVVIAAASLAARHGKPFLLNPAPATHLPEKLLDRVTLLTPNEHELSILFPEHATDWRSALKARPAGVILTCGAEGAWFADTDSQLCHQPAFSVTPVDTTGAGDTFNGALAAFWGMNLPELARIASAASALSVTRKGAQGGMPTHRQLFEFLSAQDNGKKTQNQGNISTITQHP